MKRSILLTSAALALSACAANFAEQSQRVAQMSTAQLWQSHGHLYGGRELLLVEAELAARGQYKSGQRYIGQSTSNAIGRSIFTRAQSSSVASQKSCSDFRSSAEAQRFFLSVGGPAMDPYNLDGDGDGYACEWGARVQRSARTNRPAPVRAYVPRRSSSRCYVGPRGGTYTLTASGRKNYDGC